MIRTFTIIILVFFIITAHSESKNNKSDCLYYLVKFDNNNKNLIDILKSNGFDISSITLDKNGSIELITNTYELHLLDSLGLNYKIEVKDLETHIENQLKQNYINKNFIFNDYFLLGSMAGFYTYKETYSFFDNLIKKYPQFFRSIDTIGYSVEKRPIICYSFSSHTKNIKKEILFTALHHAREPSGLMVICYFIHTLLKRASEGDLQTIDLLNKNLIYIIPIVNPDGYLYNQQIKPEGGGLWRKNRRLNQDSSFGVDLNRNYGDFDFWNSSNMGSSTNPKNETFRGIQPFSEPETQAIRDFCIKHNIILALNYHSYGDYLIYPYSATMSETPDSSLFRAFSMWVNRGNNIIFGRDYNTVGYYGRGTSDDWMYKTIPEKNKIYAFTVEVGKHKDGFWPLYPEIIFQQCQQYFNLNYELLLCTEANIKPIKLTSSFNYQKNSCVLNLIIQNIGVEQLSSSYNLTIIPLNNYVYLKDSSKTFNYLKPAETKSLLFDIPFPKKGFINGSLVPFVIKIQKNDLIDYDTLYTNLWYPEELYLFKNNELDSKWDLSNWGLEFDFQSNAFVLSDSPLSLYSDSSNNFITWTEPIELNCLNAYLEFETRWEIESRYDYGIIQISTNSGLIWEDIRSDRMVPASGLVKSRQIENSFGFAGFFPEWVDQTISLEKYLGKKVIFRFGLLSDAAKHFDGWFLKNIKLKLYNELDWTSINDYSYEFKKLLKNKIIKKNEFITLDIDHEFSDYLTVRIRNYIGQLIFEKTFQNQSYININESFNSGFYLIELINKDKVIRDKFIICE